MIVRPHPDIALLGPDVPMEQFRWPAARGMQGLVSRPFDDPRAVVLRTSDRAMQGLHECIVHSAAVVGLNTSAELEAAIVGRPVYTVLAGDADADGQSGTLHFHYLLEREGGFVRAANGLDAHIDQLDAELAAPSDPAAIRRFVGEFLRPHGIDRPVSSLLAEQLERTFAGTAGAVAKTEDASADANDAHDADTDDAVLDVGVGGDFVSTVRVRPSVAVQFGKNGAGIQMVAPEDGESYRLDKSVVRWIVDRVGIGDVVYDLAAGAGLYTVIAARHRGATVVAFEPGYAAFKDLCDNLLLNGCDGAVAPLPVALADFEGFGRLKFPLGHPGQSRHAVHAEPWKPRRPAGEGRSLVQPVCATSLDRAVERYELPPANHLRIGNLASVRAVIDGAAATLAHRSLRTVFVTMLDADREWATERLASQGFSEALAKPLRRGRTHAIFARQA